MSVDQTTAAAAAAATTITLPKAPEQQQQQKQEAPPPPGESHSSEYAPYPKLDPNDVAPPPQPQPDHQNLSSQHFRRRCHYHARGVQSLRLCCTRYHFFYQESVLPPSLLLCVCSIPLFAYVLLLFADTLDSLKDVLGRWGKRAAEATKKAEDLAGNMW